MTWELRGPGCIGQSIVVRSFMASAAIRPAIADTRYIQSKVLLRSALCVRHPPRLQHSSMVQAAAAQQNGPSSETATLACGCFWSPDAKFAKLDGVLSTRVGYTGGSSPNPTYNSVCSGDGHTEAVKVEFNPEQLPYDGLLKVFFKEHDATLSKGKPQYKSAIWYHTDHQKEVAEQMINQISAQSNKPVATDLAPASQWTDAEDYHQNYYHKSGM